MRYMNASYTMKIFLPKPSYEFKHKCCYKEWYNLFCNSVTYSQIGYIIITNNDSGSNSSLFVVETQNTPLQIYDKYFLIAQWISAT